MGKVCLLIDECTPGMRLADDVISPYGAVLATQGTLLTDSVFKRLFLNNVELVFVYDYEKGNASKYEKTVFKETYESYSNGLRRIISSINEGNVLKSEVFEEITENIFSMICNITTVNILDCLKQLGDADNYTYNHCLNVSMLCMLLGKWMRFNDEDILKVGLTGLVHDIGKAYVPTEILNKPGKLTEGEFEIVKEHCKYGYDYVRKLKGIDEAVLNGILMHHEREDGSGYPNGYKGHEIHSFAKIVAVCDVFDAMTSERYYCPAQSPFKVIEMFQNRCYGYLDTNALYTFLKNISRYYIGDEVKLTTGERGKICFINPFNVARPIVKVENDYIDLSQKMDIDIESLECQSG